MALPARELRPSTRTSLPVSSLTATKPESVPTSMYPSSSSSFSSSYTQAQADTGHRARSHVQPNSTKSAGTEAHDAATRGNDSATGSKAHDVKEKIANVFRSDEKKNPNV